MAKQNKVQGTAAITAVGNADIIAAGGATYRTFIEKVIVSVSEYHEDGHVALDNGTTTYWLINAKAGVGGTSWTLDFGEDGLDIGLNTAFRIVQSGHDDVSAIATAIGHRG